MSPRVSLILAGLAGLVAVIASLFSDHVLGWRPCYLCVTQRTLFAGVAALGLLGAMLPQANRLPSLGLVSLLALTGVATAGGQVYIQLNADKLACSGGAPNLLEASVEWLAEHLGSFFQVTGFCSDPYPVLGIPMAGWSVMLFGAICLVAALSIFKAR